MLILLATLVAASAQAQIQPFVFTVTTLPDAGGGRLGVRYDAGYAERTAPAFGYDGLEQRVGAQGSLGSGFTLLGQVGLGIGGEADILSTLEAELLKDFLRMSLGWVF